MCIRPLPKYLPADFRRALRDYIHLTCRFTLNVEIKNVRCNPYRLREFVCYVHPLRREIEQEANVRATKRAVSME